MTLGDLQIMLGVCNNCNANFTKPLEIGEDLQCPVCKSTNWRYHHYEKKYVNWKIYDTAKKLYYVPGVFYSMNCPNCNKSMDGLSMSGDDTRITHEYYCNHCHTYLKYEYNPEVTGKVIKEGVI